MQPGSLRDSFALFSIIFMNSSIRSSLISASTMTLKGLLPVVEADADMAVKEVGFTNERRVFVNADADVVVDDDDDDTVAKAKCLLTIPVPVVNAKDDDDDNGRDASASSDADDRNFISRVGCRGLVFVEEYL